MKCFIFFLLFYNVLDLNNQKILWLPSILLFERTVHNLDHPNMLICIFTYSCLLRFKRVKMANPTTDKANTEQMAITIITVVLSLSSGGEGVKIGVVVDFVV